MSWFDDAPENPEKEELIQLLRDTIDSSETDRFSETDTDETPRKDTDRASETDRGMDTDTVEFDHPSRAVKKGLVDDRDEYHRLLHDVSVEAAKRDIDSLFSYKERSVVNAVRTYESVVEAGNLLSERRDDWRDETGSEEPSVLDGLDDEVSRLNDFREEVKRYIETRVSEIAPNLSETAPEMVAARLIEKAGGLRELAMMPSSTVQVLGAEDSLFNHLKKGSPPPKHGVIYLHPYVRNTRKEERGSAARLVAGKLTIAARIDYYRGEKDESLPQELNEKINQIRAR